MQSILEVGSEQLRINIIISASEEDSLNIVNSKNAKKVLNWRQLAKRGQKMRNKNFWILLLLLLSGIVLGGFLGSLAEGISWLSWLNFGQSFGLDTPLVLNFGVLVITFGLSIRITMASIIGVAVALIIYRYI